MTNYFYTGINGQKIGPISETQLKELAARGAIRPDTQLETDTGQPCVAGQVLGMFAVNNRTMLPDTYTPSAVPMPLIVVFSIIVFIGICGFGYYLLSDTGAKTQSKLSDTREEAQFKQGMLYFEGKDAPQDFMEAVKWFRMAGDRGHIEAQYLLGSCYYLGNGVPQDNAKAIEWWRKAAKQKHKDAIAILQGLKEEID